MKLLSLPGMTLEAKWEGLITQHITALTLPACSYATVCCRVLCKACRGLLWSRGLSAASRGSPGTV